MTMAVEEIHERSVWARQSSFRIPTLSHVISITAYAG